MDLPSFACSISPSAQPNFPQQFKRLQSHEKNDQPGHRSLPVTDWTKGVFDGSVLVQAIEFVQMQQDDELWDLLITLALAQPPLTGRFAKLGM
jgi:hypothetical protein